MLGGITNSGIELLSQAVGGDKLEFVFMKLGSDYPTPLEDYKTFTSVQDPKVEVKTRRTCWVGENKVQTTAHLLLKDLKQSMVLHEMGLYATLTSKLGVQREPVLYAYYYQEVGETLSPDTLIERTFCIETLLDHATSIEVVIDDSVEFITHEQFHRHTEDTSNPHLVSAEQVGLGEVYNSPQANRREVRKYFEGDTSNNKKYLNVQEGAYLTTLFVTEHLEQPNPHRITKETVGLDQVKNYPMATFEDLKEVRNDKYLTPAMARLLTIYQIETANLLLEYFQDYGKLLQKDKLLAGPNMAIVPTPEGLKVTYVGTTNPSTYSWNNIIEGNFEGHPDVEATLQKYIKNITSADSSVKVERVEGGYNLEVSFKPTFKDLQGNPVDNVLLERILKTKLEASSLTGTSDFVIKRSSGAVEIALSEDAKSVTWEKVGGDIKLNSTLKSYIEELSLQKSELATSIRGGTGVVVTVAPDGALVINSTGTGTSVDLTPYLTKSEAEQIYSKKGEGGTGGDLSDFYNKEQVDQKLEGKLGILEEYPQLATTQKTVIGSLNQQATVLDAVRETVVELGKSSVDYKEQTVKAVNSKAGSQLTLESTTQEVVGVINALETGGGFVAPEYDELIFGFPYLTQANGYSGLQWQIGGDVAVASRENILFVMTRVHEFNFQCARMEFSSDIRVIQISNGGKYFVIGFTDKWGVYLSSTLEEVHSLTTFYNATPQFTHDELHLAYWQDAQSLILYNLATKEQKLVKGTVGAIKYISNDLKYYHSNYVYNIQDGKSVQCQGVAPTHYLGDKMYYTTAGKLQRFTYSGTTQTVEDILLEGVNSLICSNTHMITWNSTSKTLTWYNSSLEVTKSIQGCQALPNKVFGEYAMYDFANNSFPRMYLGTEEIVFTNSWSHNYSVDGSIFYVKSSLPGVNKVYRFKNSGQGFVLDGTLTFDTTVSSLYCSPNGKNLSVTSNSKLNLYTDMELVREVSLSGQIPLDNMDYVIGTNGTLMKWNGSSYITVYSGYAASLNRELTMSTLYGSRAVEIYKPTEKLRFDLPETCTLCCKNLMIGQFKTYIMNTETGEWTSRPTTVRQPTFNITDSAYFVLGEGYSYMEGSSVAKINPYLQYTKAQGLTLFGTQHVTSLEITTT